MRRMIGNLLPGWSITRWDGTESAEPVLRLTCNDPDLVITGDWVPEELSRSDPVDAACGFIAELIRTYVNELTGKFCLHAAAAFFDGSLVVFPSTHRAGKSVLCSALVAAGIRLAGDDIILIDADDGSGVAGGFCPRLRLPLPEALHSSTRAFIDAHKGPVGGRYLYLELDEAALARKGERALISGIVLLDRTEDRPAALDTIDQAEALKTVIFQNFARQQPPPVILQRLYQIVLRAGLFRLTYSRAEECVDLLIDQFGNDQHTDECLRLPVDISMQDETGTALLDAGTSIPSDTAEGSGFHRNPDVSEIEVNGQKFLANSQSGQITWLNEAASAVWHLLGETMTANDIIDLMTVAFPDVEPQILTEDVQRVLRDLVKSGYLIEPMGGEKNSPAPSSHEDTEGKKARG